MHPAIIITGQTATGKSARGITVAQKNGGHIISADSRQIYKDLTIVTGKDIGSSSYVHVHTIADDVQVGYYEVDTVKIWGYDLIDPKRVFSSHDYAQYVLYILQNTIEQGVVPIVIGGTYLYVGELLDGRSVQAEPDWNLRKQLEKKDVVSLQNLLLEKDPQLYASLNHSDQHNPHRLIRKIEIASTPDAHIQPKPLIKAEKYIGLIHSSDDLMRQRIESRVHERLSSGALEETQSLLDRGYTSTDPGLKGIGYPQLIDHINGLTSLEEATELWIIAEIQYAKRQYTFMKRDTRIEWEEV